jgi:protocatechuate 3,4-dioxygenase beta subunit
MSIHLLIMLLSSLLATASVAASAEAGAETAPQFRCQPTPADEMGPFYRAGAPLRSVIGTGYLLSGKVTSAGDCAPLASALIEFWQAGPDGRYDDAHRAAIITGAAGYYQLETDFPAAYLTRPPHIHIRVSAPGFQTLVTQHYLQPGADQASFELVLIPEP